MWETRKRIFNASFCFFLAALLAFLPSANIFAATDSVDSFLEKFANNDIIFYDPRCKGDCKVECTSVSGQDVVIIGGSIVNDSTVKAKIKEKYSDIPDGQINAAANRTWDEGITALRTTGTKKVVVFALGESDTSSITAGQINDLLAVVGTSKTLVLVTPYSTGASASTLESSASQMKSTAKSNSQIKIADWASAAKSANATLSDSANNILPSTDAEKALYASTLTGAIGGSCNSGEAVISGTTAKEKVWSGFKSLGYSDEAVAGIMGNIEAESNYNPAQWEASKKSYWGATFKELGQSNPHNMGMGLIGFTYYTYYQLLDDYYNEHAPDLLSVLQDPFTYSTNGSSNYCDGECFLKKVDESTANRLYSTQITIIDQVVMGKAMKKYGVPKNGDAKGIKNQTSAKAAADYWMEQMEIPAGDSKTKREGFAEAVYNQFKGKTSFGSGTTGGTTGTNCENNKASTNFKKYNFTDAQLRGILSMAEHENGSTLRAVKSEVSIMANLYEKKGGNYSDLIDYVKNGKWFASDTVAAYNESHNPAFGNEELEAAKDILNNGNRTLPPQIDEHDMIGDIETAKNNGTEIDKTDRSKYVRGTTIIHNKYGSTFTFYAWADDVEKKGDPFGYTSGEPDSDFNAEKTAEAGNTKTTVDIKWSSGWITSGMDGFTKGTPEAGGITVEDSSPTLNYETNKPSGNMGANKITLLSTESTDEGAGSYGVGLYSASKTPPHFTVDLKSKRVYQHYSIDKPAAAMEGTDTVAGVQIAIIGYASSSQSSSPWYIPKEDNFGEDGWEYLAKLIFGICKHLGVDIKSTVDWASPTRLGESDFKGYSGILGQMHAPSTTKTGPGNIWKFMSDKFSEFQTAAEKQADDCGEGSGMQREFEWWGQCDERWGSKTWGSCSSSICDSGCGCTSAAMLTTMLTGIVIDPGEMCTTLGNRGDHICGVGSSTLVGEHAVEYANSVSESKGLSVRLEAVSSKTDNAEQISNKLREGWVVWMCGGHHEVFSERGHCIGIRGITAEGRWLVADSKGRGKKISLEQDWDGADILPHNTGARTFIRIKQ